MATELLPVSVVVGTVFIAVEVVIGFAAITGIVPLPSNASRSGVVCDIIRLAVALVLVPSILVYVLSWSNSLPSRVELADVAVTKKRIYT